MSGRSINRRAVSTTIVLVVGGALGACATQPDELPTQYVSPVQYQGYDCTEVASEMERVSSRINGLYGSLKKTADNDAAQMGLGLVLFWPALFFLEGGDSPQAAEYSRLKGEYDALEQVAIRKSCSVPTSARIVNWPAQAQEAAKESCPTPGTPRLIHASGSREEYRVPCGDASELVRCESGECEVL